MQTYRTFLYTVRDTPALRVKYGYITAPDMAAARKSLHSRYSTYYYSCELLHVVPVARKGVDAEEALKARLASYYIGREFLTFPDEATLQAELRSAFEEAACTEELAARRESWRGCRSAEKKRVREKAEVAAAVEVAVIAKKRKLELRQQASAKRGERVRQRQTKKLTQERDDVGAWFDVSVKVVDGSLLTLKQAFTHYKQQGGMRPKGKFSAALRRLLTATCIAFKDQSTRDGVKVTNFWEGVRLV